MCPKEIYQIARKKLKVRRSAMLRIMRCYSDYRLQQSRLWTKRAMIAAVLLFAATIVKPAQAAEKIAIVNMQTALLSTKDGQKASQDLNAKITPKRKEFAARQNEITQLEDQLQKSGTLITDEKRQDLARSIDEKKRRLQRDTQDAEQDLQSEQQHMLQTLGQRMMAVINKYAQDNGYSLVIDVGNPNTPVVYAAAGVNITNQVAALYDKTSVNGAPAQTPDIPSKSKPSPSTALGPSTR